LLADRFELRSWSRIAELEQQVKDLHRLLRTGPNQLQGPEVEGSPSHSAQFLSDAGSEESDAQTAAQLSIIMGLAVSQMRLEDIDIAPELFLQCIDLSDYPL
jgi:hypothetical protein